MYKIIINMKWETLNTYDNTFLLLKHENPKHTVVIVFQTDSGGQQQILFGHSVAQKN